MADFNSGRFGSSAASRNGTGSIDRLAESLRSQAEALASFNSARFDAPDLKGITKDNLAEALGVQRAGYEARAAGQPTTTQAFDAFMLNRPDVAFATTAPPNPAAAPFEALTKGAAVTPGTKTKDLKTDIVADVVAAGPAQPSTLGGALSGFMNGVNGFTSGLMTGNLDKAFTAVADPTSSKATAAGAKATAEQATQTTQAAAKSQGFMQQDTNLVGAIGAIAGGMFAGAPGSIAGGLVGQAIGKAFDSISAEKAAKDIETKADGLLGGVGRAIEGLFGGLTSDPYAADRAAGMPSGGWTADSFPNAPSAPSGGGGGGSWDSSLSDQANAAHDRGDVGLY